MKVMLLFSLLFVTSVCFSQNVGVGTNTPSQRLDVNGNINTTGNLMINGTAGANGQVLSMNGGAMEWMDKSRFNNRVTYNNSASFSVPAGVTEVMLEMWGAGGGGHTPGGGGGGGGYWVGLIPVSSIATISLTVGTGGSSGNGTTPGGAGGNSGFSCTGFNVSVGGGTGADSSLNANTELYLGGVGGAGMVAGETLPFVFRNFFHVRGNDGSATRIDFVQVNSTTFSRLMIGGTGGVAPYSGQTIPSASYFLNNPSPPDIASRNATTPPSTNFGTGGTPQIFSFGMPGGNGRINIYY